MAEQAEVVGQIAGPYSIGSTLLPGVSKLIEEAGEALQVLGKLVATGGESEHFDGSELDRRLEEEIADLEAAIAFVKQANTHRLDWGRIAFRAEDKRRLFWKWHNEQRQSSGLWPEPVPD